MASVYADLLQIDKFRLFYLHQWMQRFVQGCEKCINCYFGGSHHVRNKKELSAAKAIFGAMEMFFIAEQCAAIKNQEKL